MNPKRYASAMEVLFERPYISVQSSNPNAPRGQRRPTELMWECDRWIKLMMQLGFTALIADFSQKERSPNDFDIASERLDEHLQIGRAHV